MKHNIKLIFNKAREFSLTSEEKDLGCEQLLTFMKAHPMGEAPIRSPFWSSRFQMALLPTLLLLVVFTGGLSFAAQDSLPGDALYPIKIYLNENLQTTFSFDPESRAQVEAYQASARLSEAEKLATQDKLTVEIKTALEQNFNTHADEVAGQIKELQDKGDSEKALAVQDAFQSTLTAHQSLLLQLADKDSHQGDRDNLIDLAQKVQVGISIASTASSSLQNQVATKTSAEGALSKTLVAINTVKKLAASTDVSSGVRTELDAKINQANQAVAEGQINLQNAKYQDASRSFRLAYKTAKQASEFIEGQRKIGGPVAASLRVGITVSVATTTATSTATSTENIKDSTITATSTASTSVQIKVDTSTVKTEIQVIPPPVHITVPHL